MTNQTRSKRQMRGYSMLELLVVMGIISLLSAFAAPSLVGTYRNYQMDDAATQVAGIIKFARYEAVRQNKPLNCTITTVNGYTAMYADSNGDSVINPGEKEIKFGGTAGLVTAGSVPSAAALNAKVQAGSLTTINPTNGSISFDGRGAKTTAGVSVYWVGNANYGWRAVTVMPSGSVQVWSYATGTWTQLS